MAKITLQEKQCRVCRESKDLSEFPIRKDSKDGRNNRCSSCNRTSVRAWTRSNRERARENSERWKKDNPEQWQKIQRRSWLARTYGITLEEFDRLLIEQNGSCGMCRESFVATPSVDHDHLTGKVRGLLCKGCNVALGFIEAHLENGLDYLESRS